MTLQLSHDIMTWGVIIALVILTTMTGVWLNRFFTYRAHRRALAELRRRAMAQASSRSDSQAVVTAQSVVSDH